MAGVEIICFTSCYIITLIVELVRIRLIHSRWDGLVSALELGTLFTGLIAHTAYLVIRAINVERIPLSCERDWYLVAAWVMVCIGTTLISAPKRRWWGVYILPIVLILIFIAKFFASSEEYGYQPVSRIWNMLHGISMILTTVTILMGFITGMLFLYQASQLKRRKRLTWLFTQRLRIPSLEWLSRMNRRALRCTFVTLLLGVLSGLVLNRLGIFQGRSSVTFSDPFVFGATLLLLWLGISLFRESIHKHTCENHQMAYRTVWCFVALALILILGLFVNHRAIREPHPMEPPSRKLEIPEGSAQIFPEMELSMRAVAFSIHHHAPRHLWDELEGAL